jgi:hypothetical protein
VRSKLSYLTVVPTATEKKGGYSFWICRSFVCWRFPNINGQLNVIDHFVYLLTSCLEKLPIAIEWECSVLTFACGFHVI